MSVQPVKQRESRQASRTRPLSAQVRELIELANCVPPDQELPSSMDLFTRYARTGYQNFFEQFPKETFNEFRTIIGPVDEEHIESALQQYSLVRDAREILRTIARKENKDPGQIVQFVTLFGSATLISLKVNESGKIEIVHDRLLELLTHIEVARIRECKVCNFIFWAGRIDQLCCSTNHARVQRTREWRQNYAGRFKLRRTRKAELRTRKASEDQS